MEQQTVTAIFDIGRTNKKFFLFDASYHEVHREYISLPEITDEDGYPTEDLAALVEWMESVMDRICRSRKYHILALNFSTYGASLVHIDAEGRVVAPLYNYTKPCDEGLLQQFYDAYGPEEAFTLATGSPRAGLLNSGVQLYWLKHRQPAVFARIRYSLHLPQFLSYLFTGIPVSEYTSIGCHTALWDYRRRDYHAWVDAEGLREVLSPVVATQTSVNTTYQGRSITVGVGIHDSSAALLPYLRGEAEPFILLSTGTWCVTLNPFAEGFLAAEDLHYDCINYMRVDGLPVKAARLYLGKEYEHQLIVLSDHFRVDETRHRSIRFDPSMYGRMMADFEPWYQLQEIDYPDNPVETIIRTDSFVYAYHHLMVELVNLQAERMRAAIGTTAVKTIFVEGGFADNDVFLHLIARHFPESDLRIADSSLGSALGAALCTTYLDRPADFLQTNYRLQTFTPNSRAETG
ncbi:FGGY-family carbohydrate kinase [Neolewinella litorea]|uniref:Carbohydrate kinase n=1 Tax=Neolewinella litorea TaxID=2562452 RepID=A0A4S4NAK2_9BACT|nr:FGGY family carbohydrate kinase [Neolewinella litorea]THH35001.1 carbohydrate kinase [Neolewinella litorea]